MTRRSEYINQPSAVPTEKIQAVGVMGCTITVLMFILAEFNIEIPFEVVSAFVTLLVFLAGYFTKNKRVPGG